MNDRFQEMQLFVRVAETGSFSRAGRELGHAQPTVSRIISALEARLGVKLLARTTRKVLPTEAGALLLDKAGQLEPDYEDEILKAALVVRGGAVTNPALAV